MQRAVVELERDDAAADAVVVHDQIDGEELDVEYRRMAQALPYIGCSMGLPCGRAAQVLRAGPFRIHGHAAERAW
jgi:hypothetical protein